MGYVKVCDICKRKLDSEDFEGFRVKQHKLCFNSTGYSGYGWFRRWEEIDMCRDCFKTLKLIATHPAFIKEWENRKSEE